MSREYNNMLNEYLHYDLMKEEIEKKSYLWKTAEHDMDFVGSDLIIPFQSTKATSVKSGGGPIAVNQISMHKHVRGTVNYASAPKIWAAAKFEREDLFDHEGKLNKGSFLGNYLPQQIEDLSEYFAEVVNHQILNTKQIDKVKTTTDLTHGIIEVNRIERFQLGQKVTIDSGADKTGWVGQVDINKGTITIMNALSGGAALDLTGVAVGEKIYNDGFKDSSLSSLRDLLLAIENGGSANIFGVSKTSSVFTQALNISGADITKANIIEKLFDAYSKYKRICKVGASEVWMSYKHLGSLMAKVEETKSPYKVTPTQTKAGLYNWDEFEIFGPKGKLRVVAIPEFDDDVMFLMDPKSFKIHSNKGIVKIKDANGNFYTVIRDEADDFKYVTDMVFKGEFVLHHPHRDAVIHSISYN